MKPNAESAMCYNTQIDIHLTSVQMKISLNTHSADTYTLESFQKLSAFAALPQCNGEEETFGIDSVMLKLRCASYADGMLFGKGSLVKVTLRVFLPHSHVPAVRAHRKSVVTVIQPEW